MRVNGRYGFGLQVARFRAGVVVEAKQHGEHGWNHRQIADELNITAPARNNSGQVETVEATGSVRCCSAVPCC